jgi:hypothetical protein
MIVTASFRIGFLTRRKYPTFLLALRIDVAEMIISAKAGLLCTSSTRVLAISIVTRNSYDRPCACSQRPKLSRAVRSAAARCFRFVTAHVTHTHTLRATSARETRRTLFRSTAGRKEITSGWRPTTEMSHTWLLHACCDANASARCLHVELRLAGCILRTA